MPNTNELQTFLKTWDQVAEGTIKLLEALPKDQYDFHADKESRSLGEMAWHLAELDGYSSWIVANPTKSGEKPPGIERPRDVASLATGYARIHKDAIERLSKLTPAVLDETRPFFGGRELPVRQILWDATLHHQLHHRGQLVLMCRLAGGTPPGLFGPNREATAAMRAQQAAKA